MEKEAIPRWGSYHTQTPKMSAHRRLAAARHEMFKSSTKQNPDLHSSGHRRLIKQQLQHVETHHQYTHHLKTRAAVPLKKYFTQWQIKAEFMNVVVTYRQRKKPEHCQWIAQVSLPWRCFPAHLFWGGGRQETTDECAATNDCALQKEGFLSPSYLPRATRLLRTVSYSFLIASMFSLTQHDVLVPSNQTDRKSLTFTVRSWKWVENTVTNLQLSFLFSESSSNTVQLRVSSTSSSSWTGQ